MPKPYSIFKLQNGIFYAQIRLPDGTRSTKRSTGCYSRAEAERVAIKWIAEGAVPERTNGKSKEEKTSLDKLTLFNNLKTFDFSQKDVEEMTDILKRRGLIISAVIPSTPEARLIEDYLEEFWDMEKSPYIREKKLKGQTIQLHHVSNQLGRARKYWIPRLKGKSIGEITRDDINAIYEDPDVMKLAPKTANEIVAAVTLPMKYAYQTGLTNNNCYDGIIKRANKSEPRIILSYEETKALFDADWDNDMVKLACLLSCYTGMRRGEVAALRLRDIGKDRIYIRHSFDNYEDLKSTKTGEEREMPISPLLRDMLLAQSELNAYNEGADSYIFFGLVPGKPTDPGNWLKYMRRTLETLGYKNPEEITFHSFRHEWCTTALTEIGDKRVCMIGSGHKTDSVFANYSNHVQKEEALKKIAAAAEKVFMPMVEATEKVEYEVIEG